MVMRGPPTSEKAYDDNPAEKLKKEQGPVNPSKSTSEPDVKAVAMGVSDEPKHESTKGILTKAAKHLAYHSHSGIHKVV
jgi:hypothetical protein